MHLIIIVIIIITAALLCSHALLSESQKVKLGLLRESYREYIIVIIIVAIIREFI